MNRFYIFLCSLVVYGVNILTPLSSEAIPIIIAKGEDEILRRSGVPEHYTQLARFQDQRRLKYFRFHDPQRDTLQDGIPLHPHAINWDHDLDQWHLPQTFRAALLQSLFPSPTGITFAANALNTSVDPIGGLKDPKLMGSLLRVVEDEWLKPTSQGHFRRTVYTLLSNKLLPKAQRLLIGDIQDLYPDFMRCEVIISYAQNLTRFISETDDESLMESGLKRDSPTILNDAAHFDPGGQYLFKRRFLGKRPFLKEGELDVLYQGSLNLNQDQLTKKLNLRIYRFADIVTLALEEQRRDPSFYPPNFVERMLIGFFMTKVKTRPDIVLFLGSVFPERVNTEVLSSLPTYQELDYQALRDHDQFLTVYQATPEVLLFMDEGYSLFENPLAPVIPQGVGIYQNYRFTDCVEIAIFQAFNTFTRQKRGARYVYDPSIFAKNKRLLDFYRHFDSSESLIRTDARDAFNDIISNLPHVRYQKKTHEMPIGWINTLNAIFVLLDGEEAVPMPFEPNDDLLRTRLSDLCARISNHDALFGYNFQSLDFSRSVRDYHGKITFTLNGTPTFEWGFYHVSGGHAHFTHLIHPKPEWKTKVPVPDILQRPELRKYLPSVVNEEALTLAMGGYGTPQEKVMLFSALHLDDDATKLSVIGTIYGDDPTLRPHAHGLIGPVILNYRNEIPLLSILVTSWMRHPLRDQRVEDQDSITVLTGHPRLLNVSVKNSLGPHESSRKSLFDLAIIHNKQAWIDIAHQNLQHLSIHLDVLNLSFLNSFMKISTSFRHLQNVTLTITDDAVGTCATTLTAEPFLLPKLHSLIIKGQNESFPPIQSTLILLEQELPSLKYLILDFSDIEMTECRRILGLFFSSHPRAQLNFRKRSIFMRPQQEELFSVLDGLAVPRDHLVFS